MIKSLWRQMRPTNQTILFFAFLVYLLSRVSLAQESAPALDSSIFANSPQAGPCQQCLMTCRGQANNPPKTPDIAVLRGWNYRGCWTDNVKDRTLIGKRFRGHGLNVERCAQFCADYQFFGVEYSDESISLSPLDMD